MHGFCVQRAESARTVSNHLFDVIASTEENVSEIWDLRGQPNSVFRMSAFSNHFALESFSAVRSRSPLILWIRPASWCTLGVFPVEGFQLVRQSRLQDVQQAVPFDNKGGVVCKLFEVLCVKLDSCLGASLVAY